jgi:hypothetical protein
MPVGTRVEFPLTLYDHDIGKKDDLMGTLIVRPSDFFDFKDKWFPLTTGQGEMHLGLRVVGTTWYYVWLRWKTPHFCFTSSFSILDCRTRYQHTPHAFWREWPSVVRIQAILERVLPNVVVGVFSWRHFLFNLYAKIPTYNQVRNTCVTKVTFFNDVNHIVPRPKAHHN